jgi:hypothetical protein
MRIFLKLFNRLLENASIKSLGYFFKIQNWISGCYIGADAWFPKAFRKSRRITGNVKAPILTTTSMVTTISKMLNEW